MSYTLAHDYPCIS